MPVPRPAERMPPASTDEFVSSIHLHHPAPHPLVKVGIQRYEHVRSNEPMSRGPGQTCFLRTDQKSTAQIATTYANQNQMSTAPEASGNLSIGFCPPNLSSPASTCSWKIWRCRLLVSSCGTPQ